MSSKKQFDSVRQKNPKKLSNVLQKNMKCNGNATSTHAKKKGETYPKNIFFFFSLTKYRSMYPDFSSE